MMLSNQNTAKQTLKDRQADQKFPVTEENLGTKESQLWKRKSGPKRKKSLEEKREKRGPKLNNVKINK